MAPHKDPGCRPDPFLTRRVVRSEELFAGGREIVIEHRQDHYRLMITKTGKLILNK